MITAGADPSICFWDLKNYKLYNTIYTSPGHAWHEMAYIRQRNYLVIGFLDGGLYFYDLVKWAQIGSYKISHKGKNCFSLKYIEEKGLLIGGVFEGSVKVWKLNQF